MSDLCNVKWVVRYHKSFYECVDLSRVPAHVSRGLRDLGIGHGDCAVLFMPNSLDYLFSWFALNKLGAIEAPINLPYKGRFLEHQVNICKASSIIVDVDLHRPQAGSIGDAGRPHRMV